MKLIQLNDLSEFNVNPFLLLYNANYLTGNNDAKSVAKSLIYPRVLGTSINTSFGTQFQYFISNTLSGYVSAIQGLDIEFVDQIDSRRKYCQLKAGPNTINKDDVQTIINHFNGVRNLARTIDCQLG
ncbi:hypothetical protein U473_12420 [Tepidibacillus decaturensis]|uniref:Type II restriction endonuclease EcoO109IR domain-containing protein n=1 Tax=Tepidibacillus decaturensis TaxID=1413211 RepID=A0A135L730_9BACI|nr:hypothetical protein U473_12420 [Tepidibacillus decaturensis]